MKKVKQKVKVVTLDLRDWLNDNWLRLTRKGNDASTVHKQKPNR